MLDEPDRGYAWVVLAGSCVVNALLSGTSRMVGMLYVALVEHYGATREQAALPFTLRNAVRYFAGESQVLPYFPMNHTSGTEVRGSSDF